MIGCAVWARSLLSACHRLVAAAAAIDIINSLFR